MSRSALSAETVESVTQKASGGTRHRRRARGKAEVGTVRGLLWTLVVAVDFLLMSNPLVFVASMDRALTLATIITGAALVVTVSSVRIPRISPSVALFLGWLLLSYTWSIQPTFTAQAWAQTTAVAAVAVAIYTNVSARVLATGFTLGGVVAVAGSVYAFRAGLPGGEIAPADEWVMAGIGTNPNILAYTLTLALCGAFAMVPGHAWARVLWLGALGIIAYGLLEVGSATGVLTAVTLAVAAVLMAAYGPATRRFLHTTGRRVGAGLVTMAVVSAALVLHTQVMSQQLLTFSDRTSLWSAAITVAQERPVAGFGYGAVWQHPWKPPLLNIVIGDIWEGSGGIPLSHGHNSAIDLVVEVGIVGVLLMLVIMVSAGVRATRLLRADDDTDPVIARFIVLCLVDLTLFGVTEPMAVIPLGWWALVLLSEPMSRSLGRSRNARGRSSTPDDKMARPTGTLSGEG